MTVPRFLENVGIKLVLFAIIAFIVWTFLKDKGDAAKAAAGVGAAVASAVPIL